MSLDWIKEVAIEDLLEKDTRLIYDHCGMEVLESLWVNLPSLPLFISTKPLIAAKKRYARKFYDGSNIKKLAATLGVSDRFIHEAVATTEPKDDLRQGKLLDD